MFVVMNTAKLAELEINGERFRSLVTISKTRKKEQRRDSDDENNSMTCLLRDNDHPRLSSEGNRNCTSLDATF